MRAVIWTNYGPPEVLQLQEVAQPIPRRDEILIKVHAANAFAGDAEMRRFEMHPSMWIPLRLFMGIRRPRLKVLGQEIAGIVEAVGDDVREFVPGDPVFGATGMRFGGYAEYVSLPARYALARKPEAISYEQASTIAVGGGNALHFIRLARLKAGERILIYGGCIGSYAVQLAKMNGAEITGDRQRRQAQCTPQAWCRPCHRLRARRFHATACEVRRDSRYRR